MHKHTLQKYTLETEFVWLKYCIFFQTKLDSVYEIPLNSIQHHQIVPVFINFSCSYYIYIWFCNIISYSCSIKFTCIEYQQNSCFCTLFPAHMYDVLLQCNNLAKPQSLSKCQAQLKTKSVSKTKIIQMNTLWLGIWVTTVRRWPVETSMYSFTCIRFRIHFSPECS